MLKNTLCGRNALGDPDEDERVYGYAGRLADVLFLLQKDLAYFAFRSHIFSLLHSASGLLINVCDIKNPEKAFQKILYISKCCQSFCVELNLAVKVLHVKQFL